MQERSRRHRSRYRCGMDEEEPKDEADGQTGSGHDDGELVRAAIARRFREITSGSDPVE